MVWPGEVHPAYEGNRFVIEWALGHQLGMDQWHLVIPVPSRPRWPAPGQLAPTEADVTSLRTHIMTRRQAWALAPFVGDPFVYLWDICTDELGRGIGGFTKIQHIPQEIYDDRFAETSGAWRSGDVR